MPDFGRGWMTWARPWMIGLVASALLVSGAVAQDGLRAAKRSQQAIPLFSIGPTLTIDNGIAGDGRLEVASGRGGETSTVLIDPVGAALLQNIMFELNHYVDVGADGGGVQLGNTTITQEPTVTGPNQLTSAGNFAGPNGTINWTAVASIAPGTTRYVITVSFSSTAAFGTVRFIQYVDIDVEPLDTNNLVELGTFGSPDFQLVTVQNPANGDVGMRQVAPVVTNASCIGWAARPYSQLRAAITGAGSSYAPGGSIVGLGSTTDPRFPGAPAFGPEDITSAIACDLSPTATSATVDFTISAEGSVVSGVGVPTLSEWAFIAMALILGAIAVGALRRQRLHAA
jgi:hypothetical protein